jgi:hypothetical protein
MVERTREGVLNCDCYQAGFRGVAQVSVGLTLSATKTLAEPVAPEEEPRTK